VLGILFKLALGASPLLGGELRQEGYALRPPAGFVLQRREALQGTSAAALDVTAGARSLAAVLTDGDGPDAASLWVARVEGAFDAHPAKRDEISGEVMRHFSDDLAIPMALESAHAVAGASPRIEVLGTVHQEGQARHVLVAVMAGEGRHTVITFSIPSGRYQPLAPAIQASLDSFRADPPATSPLWRRAAGAVAGGLAGAILVSMALWRRRRSAAAPPAPPERS
jgi:hypothetical protein